MKEALILPVVLETVQNAILAAYRKIIPKLKLKNSQHS